VWKPRGRAELGRRDEGNSRKNKSLRLTIEYPISQKECEESSFLCERNFLEFVFSFLKTFSSGMFDTHSLKRD
jgi:hypothetical protein